jgi:polysaccharide biosynthesis protein PslH
VRILFVKERLAWPRSAGHDVHGYHMMQALEALGHEVALLTLEPPQTEALAGLTLAFARSIRQAVLADEAAPLPLTRLQERFRSYWGIEPAHIRVVGDAASAWAADAVVAVGLNVLPYLAGLRSTGPVRVWYAADEWAWHHLSQLRIAQKRTWGNLKHAAVKGLYERAYARIVDRAWVVSAGDRRAMRWVAGIQAVDVIPNGVDCAYYQGRSVDEIPQSCVFWGRLDFGPNIQALEWFCRKVWPRLLDWAPSARFTIYGFSPVPSVHRLAQIQGICVVPDMPDLRAGIAGHQVVVLPFVSGGGIKNKLLEAASMAKAIVCTPRACGGLKGEEPLPFLRAQSASEWVEAIRGLWEGPRRRQQLGADARQWVQTSHTWETAARQAVASIEGSLPDDAHQRNLLRHSVQLVEDQDY